MASVRRDSNGRLFLMGKDKPRVDYNHVHTVVGYVVHCSNGIENCKAAQKRQEKLNGERRQDSD